MDIDRIAVTGAAGGLGIAVVDELRARDVEVVGLVRSHQDVVELEERGARAVLGDLRDEASLNELVQDSDVVLHLAAWMGSPGGFDVAREVNVAGTERVIRAAAKAGVRRVVVASSIAVHGPVEDGVVTENAPLRKIGDPYGDTKLEAEQRAREVAGAEGIELVVLRPTMIYGPRSGSWTVTPIQAIRKGLPAVIGSGEDLLDAVYVDDVARAFVLAAETPAAAGETFIVGGETTDWNTFFGAYADMYDKPVRRLPAGLVKGGARLAANTTRWLTGRERVVPETIDVMTSRATFSHEKAKDLLGYAPQVGLDEGMRRTAAWLRASGELRRPATALVTGAASGLGSAVVRELSDHGIHVYATDIREDALASLERDGVTVLSVDVTQPSSIEAARARIEEEGRTVDVLVNAAGLARPGVLLNQDLADVELQFDVNAYGPLHLARAFAPAMIERGWGRIVNVSSTNGFIVSPFMGAYSAAKFAVEALSDALRLELSPFGVEVVVVEPGAMRTPFAARAKAALDREIESESSAWAVYLQRFMNSSLWGDQGGTDPAKVARTIARIARKGGRARVHATLDAYPVRLMSMMPVGVKDLFFRSAAGLKPLEDDADASSSGDASQTDGEDARTNA